MNDDRSSGAERAVRLICRADENGVHVVSRRRLAKVAPPSEPLEEEERGGQRRSGFWIEVRDDEDRLRYRRVVADPLAGEVEVPGDAGSFTRRPVAPDSVTFALLVPDIDGAEHVSLMRGPSEGAAARQTGRLADRTGEIARLSLHDNAPGGASEPGGDSARPGG